MLSYQHIYHAGCLADVHKHLALSAILQQMVQKDKPLYYMETHAGRGIYNLNSPESLKTGEAKQGILSLMNKLPKGHPYTEIVKKSPKDVYYGSPGFAQQILRKDDRIFLCELHPQEFAALKDNFANLRNVFVYNEDGYQKVLAMSPPAVRRGVVLIDPSYEVKDEYLQAAEFVKKLHKKWGETVIILWYPILKSGLHQEMCEVLRNAGLPKFWQQEVGFTPNENNTIGSGLMVCNLPYGSEKDLDVISSVFALA